MKTVFRLGLASARWRSYLHALSVAPGNTQRQLMVSLLPEAGFLAKNQLPSQAPQWISVPGIELLNPFESERMFCPVKQLKLYLQDLERIWGADSGCSFIRTTPSETSWEVISADRSWRPSKRLTHEGVWPSYSTWGQSPVSLMGLQLSGGATWHSVSCVLEVVGSLPEFLSTRHGLYHWWDVNFGSNDVRTTSRGSRSSSPTSIAYTVCSHCYDVLNEDYLVISWYLHVWNGVAVARNPPACPAEKRSLGENLVTDRWLPCYVQMRLCTEAGRGLDFICFEIFA